MNAMSSTKSHLTVHSEKIEEDLKRKTHQIEILTQQAADRASLSTKVQLFSEENKQLSEQVNELQMKLKTNTQTWALEERKMTDKLEDMKLNLSTLEIDNKRIQNTLRALESEKEETSLRSRFKDATKFSIMSAQLSNAQSENQSLHESIADLNLKISELATKLEESEDKRRSSESQTYLVQTLRLENEKLVSELTESKEKSNSLENSQQKSSVISIELEELRKQFSSSELKRKQLEEETTSFQEQKRKATGEFKQQKNELMSRVHKLENENIVLEQAKTDLENKVLELRTQTKAFASEIQTLKTSFAMLKNKKLAATTNGNSQQPQKESRESILPSRESILPSRESLLPDPENVANGNVVVGVVQNSSVKREFAPQQKETQGQSIVQTNSQQQQ